MSRRLQTRDYARAGLYFVTICANFKRSVFGRVIGSNVRLTALGEIARQTWFTIPSHFEGDSLHAFVVMPNHVHGMIEIGATGLAQHAVPLQGRLPAAVTLGASLSAIVRSYKAEVTRRGRLELNLKGEIWQRNYFDRVIRDGREFSNASRYIAENPLQWEWDRDRENLKAGVVADKNRLAQHAVPLQRNRQSE
jgi:REP-associated tyrosine transposase